MTTKHCYKDSMTGNEFTLHFEEATSVLQIPRAAPQEQSADAAPAINLGLYLIQAAGSTSK